MKKIILTTIIATFLITPLKIYAGNIEKSYNSGKSKAEACAACHGIDGNSQIKMYPILAGQHKNYLSYALKSYKNGVRNNAIMKGFADGLSDQDIENLSLYFSKQKGLKIPPLK
jgi:cytochrome c553|tara:strand:- start:46 stop:387 length:342 start_codon:yes stop_codon:yes gene_type:complete